MSAADDSSVLALRPSAGAVADRTREQISALRHEILTTVAFPDHRHDDHQLMCAVRGSAVVTSAVGAWTIGPGSAVWMPAGVTHAMAVSPPATFLSLYLEPALAPYDDRWSRSHALEVDPLLEQLIHHLELADIDDGRRGRCAAVLVDQLAASPISDRSLPMPRDSRAAAVAAAILAAPDDSRGLVEWAAELGVSTRTLTRAFRSETTLGFGDWRGRARVTASLALLRDGHPVEEVAHRVGYANASAFIVAFRAMVGTTPGVYLRQARG
jgi:AraC-like DNA-binding protein